MDHRRASPTLLLGALGVVFGDIGTSPLYAFRSILGEASRPDETTVLGMTSLVIWSLVLVVSVLYVGMLLKADNDGEGGLLALLGLLRRSGLGARRTLVVSIVGMAGAAMFLGDSVITPAISVLSASEGLQVASPSLGRLVLPLAVLLLAGVFVLQRVGSGAIGRFYGPVMVVWFAVLAVGGAVAVAGNPHAFLALSPTSAVRFAAADPRTAFLCLGSVVLAVTGAEALYADLGHFGRPAIARTWLWVVFPALVLAYLGECARVLENPGAAADPFYAVVPAWARIPVLVVATLATVIASEAVIAGAFTVLHQAGGLGLFPFLRTEHTSPEEGGQIYVPAANWALAFAVLAVVAVFRSSERLSSAYGVAVSLTILATVTLYLVLDRARRSRSRWRQPIGAAMFLVVLVFAAACVPKLASGGWLPAGIGVVMFVVMTTWWSGQRRLRAARAEVEETAADLLHDGADRLHRTTGSAVFLTEDSRVAPIALHTMVERLHMLPQHAVMLSWRVEDTPEASAHRSSTEINRFEGCHEGLVGVDVTLGYRERLAVRHVLADAERADPEALAGLDLDSALYFVSDPIPRLSHANGMARWRQRLFLLLHRLSTPRVDQLALPRDRTVVIGRELDL